MGGMKEIWSQKIASITDYAYAIIEEKYEFTE
jgi:hypothetical protein